MKRDRTRAVLLFCGVGLVLVTAVDGVFALRKAVTGDEWKAVFELPRKKQG